MASSIYSIFYILHSRRGQAALSLVFLIGGIIILVGVSLTFIVVSFIGSNYGFQMSNRALAAASGGANDAVIKLLRDKDFSSAGYTVTIGSDSAAVAVTQNSPIAGQAKIISTGTASSYQRKIQAVAAVNATTGQVQLVSWEQLTL